MTIAALVTGSTRGIGKAIAFKLAAEGFEVIIHGNKNTEAAQNLVEQISQSGGNASYVLGDLSKPDSVPELFDKLEDKAHRLGILVNNAGVFKGSALSSLTSADIQEVLSINVTSLILLTQQFLRHKKTDFGRIINMTSFAATTAGMNASLYAASKAAVDALTRCWALELGNRSITVNSVAPGYIKTDMSAAGIGDPSPILRGIALQRVGLPEDIADVVAFLVSDAARWITGQVITANGGQIAAATFLRTL